MSPMPVVQIAVRFSTEEYAKVDEWLKNQPLEMRVTMAIKMLVLLGLEAEIEKKKKSK